MKALILFLLGACLVRAQPLVSTADWNTNAELLITAREERPNIHEWLAYFTQYNTLLSEQVKTARREDDWRKEIAFLLVLHYNLKLMRQTMLDNRYKLEDFDQADLLCRQLMESVRGALRARHVMTNDGSMGHYYRAFKKPFGNRTDLILRTP